MSEVTATLDGRPPAGAVAGAPEEQLELRRLQQALTDHLLVEAEYEERISRLRSDVASVAGESAVSLRDAIAAFEARERELLEQVEQLAQQPVVAVAVAGETVELRERLQAAEQQRQAAEEERQAAAEGRRAALAEAEALRAELSAVVAVRAQAREALLGAVDRPVFHVRTDEHNRFGPASLFELEAWAADCRIGPEHMLSSDGEHWIRALDVPEIGLDWKVPLVDGSSFGPVHLAAIAGLIEDGVVSHDAVIVNVRDGRSGTYARLLGEEVQARLMDGRRLLASFRDTILGALPAEAS